MVSRDSADVWSRQDDFRMDASVGAPPDAFSETGQDCYVVGDKDPPPGLVQFFRRWPAHTEPLDPVPFERMVDREVLEEARRGAAGKVRESVAAS